MATFKLNGTIYVRGAKCKREVIDILQTALDDYEAMNPDWATIVIHHDEPKRCKASELN